MGFVLPLIKLFDQKGTMGYKRRYIIIVFFTIIFLPLDLSVGNTLLLHNGEQVKVSKSGRQVILDHFNKAS